MNYLEDQENPQEQIKDPDNLWNRLTMILAAGTILLIILFAWIYVNPQSGINPYPPMVIPPIVQIPTNTPTTIPTETPQPTNTPQLPTPLATLRPDSLSGEYRICHHTTHRIRDCPHSG